MIRVTKAILFFLFCAFSIALIASNDNLPERPNPPRLVNNLSKEFPEFLSASEQETLEEKLVRFNDSTSNQIAIIIVDDLNGLEPEQFSTQLGRKWGVGQQDKRNGIVVLVKPTGGQGQRKTFIAVGYGLEGAIPDITARRIVDNEILPRFKAQDYYGGLDAATTVLMSLSKGEYNYKSYGKSSRKGNFSPIIIFIVVLIIIIISSFRKRSRGFTLGGGGLFYGGALLGGGFGRGFGGGGSSGGGGFGGFGGGSFGGGGSGGSW